MTFQYESMAIAKTSPRATNRIVKDIQSITKELGS